MFPKIVVPPISSTLIGFSIINHPFWGTTIFGNTHLEETTCIILPIIMEVGEISSLKDLDDFHFFTIFGDFSTEPS